MPGSSIHTAIDAIRSQSASARTPVDNEALVEGLRAGDDEAFHLLLDQFETPVYRFFFYSHRDHDRAEDQCAETFSNMITAIHKMSSPPDSLKAFVFGVARNVMRRGWRQKQLYLPGDELIALNIDNRPDACRVAAGREQVARVMEAIERFDDPERQVLLLRFVEELHLAEIAQVLGLPVGTVKSHIHRCRKRLRLILG